ncbi:hypothetical protein IWQ61_006247, partial [Dispira simplex]
MGAKRKSLPSQFRMGNNSSPSLQARPTEETDKLRKDGIEHSVEKKIKSNVSDLVSKVVGFQEPGEYEDVAVTVEKLIELSKKRFTRADKKKGLDIQKQRLCENAKNWFEWDTKGSRKPGEERHMYPYIVDYIFLISLVLEELGRDANDIAIQRRILPHPECDVRCDSDANIRYDIVLRCCGSDADVKQEYKPFESKLNPSNGAPRRRKKRKVDKQNSAEEDNDDKFRKRIKEAFGIIEVKSSPKEDGNLKTYAQLG